MKVLLSVMVDCPDGIVRIYQRKTKLPIAPFPGMGIQFSGYHLVVDYVKYVVPTKRLVATVVQAKRFKPDDQLEAKLKADGWKHAY